MKRNTGYSHRPPALGLFLFACALFLAGPALAAEQGAVPPGAELHIRGELRTGRPVKAVFDLKGYRIPAGSYASINVRFGHGPDGRPPEVKTGYPETGLVFHTPGTYSATFILNEVSKPSCGGVNAETLLEKTIELQVSD